MSLLTLKAQLPPDSKNARPCPGPGHGPTAAKETRQYLDYQNLGGPCPQYLTVAHRPARPGLGPPPAAHLHTPLAALIHTALFPAHTLIPTHPVAPAFAVASSDTAPPVRARLGGPLCVYPQFTCLNPLLDMSSVRTAL